MFYLWDPLLGWLAFFSFQYWKGGASGKNTLYINLRRKLCCLRWKLFIWGENFLSEVETFCLRWKRMLTASFHLMVWTSSSCVRCPSLPRPLIFLGRSFWYLQQSHIVISSGKHKYWYTCNMHVWSSLEWTYVRVHPNVITTQFLEHPNMKWIQGKFSDFLYLCVRNLHSNE